jgi:hypothetical protein
LAFDTVMIGLFALPRLLVMIDLEQPDLLNSSNMTRLTAYLPAELRLPAIALTLFSLVYLLAWWITPLSREFLNDPDMLGKWLPTEEKIHAFNYKQMGAGQEPRSCRASKDRACEPPGFKHRFI